MGPVQLRLLKFRFPKILEVVSRPEFAQDHESGLRFDRGPVVLFDFSKLRSWKPPYGFLNSYGRFCPYSPPYKPGGKTAPPLFLGDEIYMKIYTCSHTSILGKKYFGTPPARSETRFGILGEFRSKILLVFKMINF